MLWLIMNNCDFEAALKQQLREIEHYFLSTLVYNNITLIDLMVYLE